MNIEIIDKEHFNESLFHEIFMKSCEWFEEEPETPGVSPSQRSMWLSKLESSHGKLLICMLATEDGVRSPAGFIFTHLRPNLAGDNHTHIWLAATDPLLRRRGVMSRLFLALQTSSEDSELTVNTYPSRFPNMPSFLESQGFSVYHVEEAKDAVGPRWMFSKKTVL